MIMAVLKGVDPTAVASDGQACEALNTPVIHTKVHHVRLPDKHAVELLHLQG